MMILVLMLTSFFSFAQDCSEVNLITQNDSPFSKMPVLDQAGSNMCYAYAAAQLANYQLIKSGRANRPMVHPAWAGVLEKEKAGELELRGGYTSVALDQISSNGNCDEQLVRQAIQARAELVGVPEARIMKFLDSYGKAVRVNHYNTFSASDRASAVVKAAADNNYCPLAHWQRLIDKPELLATDSVAALRRLLADSCSEENRTNLNLPPYQTMRQGHDSDFEARIDSVLDRGNPAGMTFCSWAADRPQSSPPHYVQTVQGGYRQQTVSDKECGAHIALVAGRKSLNGSCHYLYRNTRGTGWYKDIQHLTCLCKNKRSNEFVDNCTYPKHNDGNHIVQACWVPKANLVPNIFEVINY